MARTALKLIVSKYKGVQGITTSVRTYWNARICGTVKRGYKTEREAAKSVDLILIENEK